MKSIRISTVARFLGLALLAACFNAGPASAQLLQGKFTLPFEARWGMATLPAGDYNFTIESSRTNCPVHLYRGTENVALIYTDGVQQKDSGPAQMTVMQGRVRSLSLPGIGEILEYAPAWQGPHGAPRARDCPNRAHHHPRQVNRWYPEGQMWRCLIAHGWRIHRSSCMRHRCVSPSDRPPSQCFRPLLRS